MRSCLIIIISIFFILSCKKPEQDTLDRSRFVNVLDPDTNVELIQLKGYEVIQNPLHIKLMIKTFRQNLNPETGMPRVMLFRNSYLRGWIDTENDTVFRDYDVVQGRVYKYRFAFVITGDTSKKTQEYEIFVP